MADPFIKSRTKPECPKCGTRAHILYIDAGRQLGNWEAHNTPTGQRCPHSRKKAIKSKYRGL